MSLRPAFAFLAAAASLAGGPVAAAQAGPTIPLSVTTADDQDYPDIAGLPGDGFVAVWRSQGQGAGGEDVIVMRRFDASGAPTTGEEIVSTNANGVNTVPSVASAPDGRVVVSWETFASGTGLEIRARAYAAGGGAIGTEFPVNVTTTGNQRDSDVAMAANGSFVVVWSQDTGSGGEVVARSFGPGGVSPGSEILVGAASSDDARPRIAVESAGGYVVAWTDYTANVGDVRVRRMSATGVPAFDAVTVHDTVAGTQDYPDVVLTSEGFTVVYSSAADAYARRFDPDGAPLAAPKRLNTTIAGAQGVPFAAVAPDTSLTVAWSSGGDAVGGRFSAALAPLGGEIPLPEVPSGNESPSAVVSFADAFVTSWVGGDADRSGVFARRFAFDPSPIPTPTPTPAPISAPVPAPPPAAKPAAVSFTSVATLPSAKACVSRRNFRIRLRQPKGAKLTSAMVKVNRKTVATRKGARVTAPVDLRGLPKGRFTVAITLKLADGRTVKGSRSYRTCAPRRR